MLSSTLIDVKGNLVGHQSIVLETRGEGGGERSSWVTGLKQEGERLTFDPRASFSSTSAVLIGSSRKI